MKSRFNVASSFNDLLFNTLIGFFILLLLSLALIQPKKPKTGDVTLKAEFLVSMEWPSGNKDDIDLVMVTPTKEVVFYGKQNGKVASLDRDDLGDKNDKLKLEDGTVIEVKDNWENIAIRKAIKGEFIVNVLLFRKQEMDPTPVKVKVERLNPYRLIFVGEVLLETVKQQETAIRFTLDSKGKVVHRSQDPYFVDSVVGNGR